MAVLYDNLGKATKAMEFYRRFLQVHMKDKSGVGDMNIGVVRSRAWC